MELSELSRQNVAAYDLSKLHSSSFHFYTYALWDSEGFLDFYPPLDDSRDSSGSLNAIQNFYVKNQTSIRVEAISVFSFLKQMSLTHVDILKLDIEGAPLEVITKMFKDSVYPKQIVVEFDEMHFPSIRSKYRAQKLYKLIKRNGYLLVTVDSCDFTFVSSRI
jgi:FkbM family methyltransferase